MSAVIDTAIVGAGPYALSLAAQLRALGVSHRIFGSPMHTWLAQMPRGMHLKSDGFSSNLYDRDHQFTLRRYCAEAQLPYADEGMPVRLDTFCAYGLAFQQRFVPELEQRQVTRLRADDGAFALQLDDGQALRARRVVLAVGITHFQQVPDVLAALPPELCGHSALCTDPAQFSGRDVTVIGGGASALDLAGLLHAAGAHVRLVARKPSVSFHAAPGTLPRPLWQRLSHPQSGLGPSLRSLLYSEAALLFHQLPQPTRLRIARTYLGPSGGWFMRDQVLGKVHLLLGRTVHDAQVNQGRVHLHLRGSDGTSSEIATDHVIAATGYAVDLRRLPFLDGDLLARLRSVEHTPVLSSRFETSVPGLYAIGPIAANSFGPVMRFAFGARFAAGRLSTSLARSARRVARARSATANAMTAARD